MIDEILGVLSGHTSRVRRSVEARMREAAAELDFERAAELRDVLRGLDAIERRQTAVDFRGGDRDVVGIAEDGEGEVACGVVLKVREGRLMGRQVHYLRNVEGESRDEVVGAFVKGFYLRQEDLPPELLVPAPFADRELVEEYLSARRDGPFAVRVPQRGRKRRLLDLAEENAGHVLELDRLRRGSEAGKGGTASGGGEAGGREAGGGEDGGREEEATVTSDRPAAGEAGPRSGEPAETAPAARTASDRAETAGAAARSGPPPAAARALAEALELPEAPRDLVCFDISTLGGAECVGSAVWLTDGEPTKSEYRHFRVRAAEVGRPDDYAAMQEVVGRYFESRVARGERLPDLVVVDGGRGQLSAARQGMEAAGVSDLPLAALAKREEEVFRPERAEPIRFHRADPALHWLQRARDEAHRFALRYNRTLRRRRTLRSRLSEVRGVGAEREQRLLRRFGSLRAVRSATIEELCETPGIGPATAGRIRRTLAGPNGVAAPDGEGA